MSLIDDISQQVPLSEFEMFATPKTQVIVQDDIITEHRPLSTLDANHPLDFSIATAKDEYVNFRETLLYLKLHLIVTKSDGTHVSIGDWNKIIPAQNFLHSLWENVVIRIGDKYVNNPNSTYAYRAMFDALANSGKPALDTYQQGALYMDPSDRTSHFAPKSANETKSIGKIVDLAGKIHTDLTFQDRAILGGSQILITFVPHKSSFYFKTLDTKLQLEVVFDDAYLEVHRSKVYQPIVNAHEEALRFSMAKYPINRFEVKQFTISSGTLDSYIDNAVSGQLPRRMYVAFVANDAFHGTYNTDPFNFEHFNLNYLVSYYNANQVPAKPYKPNFAEDLYIREYMNLFATSNQLFCNAKTIIDRKAFKEGMTFFGFNYSPDLADDCNSTGHLSLIRRGTLRLEMHFKTALTKTINVLLFVEYDSIINITDQRNGLTDFN